MTKYVWYSPRLNKIYIADEIQHAFFCAFGEQREDVFLGEL